MVQVDFLNFSCDSLQISRFFSVIVSKNSLFFPRSFANFSSDFELKDWRFFNHLLSKFEIYIYPRFMIVAFRDLLTKFVIFFPHPFSILYTCHDRNSSFLHSQTLDFWPNSRCFFSANIWLNMRFLHLESLDGIRIFVHSLDKIYRFLRPNDRNQHFLPRSVLKIKIFFFDNFLKRFAIFSAMNCEICNNLPPHTHMSTDENNSFFRRLFTIVERDFATTHSNFSIFFFWRSLHETHDSFYLILSDLHSIFSWRPLLSIANFSTTDWRN